MMDGHFWWGMAVFIVAVWSVALAIRWVGRSGRLNDQTPEQTLKNRYARGEINQQEYERMLHQLHR